MADGVRPPPPPPTSGPPVPPAAPILPSVPAPPPPPPGAPQVVQAGTVPVAPVVDDPWASTARDVSGAWSPLRGRVVEVVEMPVLRATTLWRELTLGCLGVGVIAELVNALALGVWQVRWPDWSQPLVDAADTLATVRIAATVLSFVFLAVWTFLTLGNIRRLGKATASPLGSAISWLVPGLNLVLPWLGLQSASLEVEAKAPIGTWWFLTIASSIATVLTPRRVDLVEVSEGLSQVERSLAISGVLTVFLLVTWSVGRSALRSIDAGVARELARFD